MGLDRGLGAAGQAQGMDHATEILRWIEDHLPPLWVVILLALVLARLDHARKLRQLGRLDGWWLGHLRRSETRSLHRRRRLSR